MDNQIVKSKEQRRILLDFKERDERILKVGRTIIDILIMLFMLTIY